MKFISTSTVKKKKTLSFSAFPVEASIKYFLFKTAQHHLKSWSCELFCLTGMEPVISTVRRALKTSHITSKWFMRREGRNTCFRCPYINIQRVSHTIPHTVIIQWLMSPDVCWLPRKERCVHAECWGFHQLLHLPPPQPSVWMLCVREPEGGANEMRLSHRRSTPRAAGRGMARWEVGGGEKKNEGWGERESEDSRTEGREVEQDEVKEDEEQEESGWDGAFADRLLLSERLQCTHLSCTGNDI